MYLIIDAATRRDTALIRQQAVFNSFAYHKPNEIPDPQEKKRVRQEVSTEAEVAEVRAWMKAMAGASNGS